MNTALSVTPKITPMSNKVVNIHVNKLINERNKKPRVRTAKDTKRSREKL